MTEPQIRARGHHLATDLPPSPIILEADAARLTQVFCNLLDNAAKYTEAGGQIWMKAQLLDCEAIVSVRDSGKGIPSTLLPHIFELFTQGAEEFGRSDSGLGVGLALVSTFVHEHGGSIDVRSAGSGQGSEFIVRLPLTGC
jgi:signal transduction histidine kinase